MTRQTGVRGRPNRSWSAPPGVIARGRNLQDPGHCTEGIHGLARAHEPVNPFGLALLSRANQAAAFARMSRSWRRRWFSRRRRPSSSRSALVGRPLPAHLKTQISRELDRLELLLSQIKLAEAEGDALRAAQETAAPASAGRMLRTFKGVGPEFAAVLWLEALFRHFDNRCQLASYAGPASTPWQSGSVDREQGVSKAGNPRLRSTLIELAWLWLRHQPQWALALWFKERVNGNGGHMNKKLIVALARASCWWRWGNTSLPPPSSKERS
jgi:transposase